MAVETLRHDIVPTHLAVKAMRDNGYKNAAYAVAELMDNSIQAGATDVELLCADREDFVQQRTRRRLDRVAVLDNGSGMTTDVLQIALQFGNGSRLDEGQHTGMGRFGMGLPSASISQARRVDVWSWQDGVGSALHSYIDLDEIQAGELQTVPAPAARPVPDEWQQAGRSFGQSGTLVVWSSLDRCLWRTSLALIRNSESLIGRMYRFWINDGRVRIRLASHLNDHPGDPVLDQEAVPNDPLYLMSKSSCPEPYSKRPMFRPYPSDEPGGNEIKLTLEFRGKPHDVVLRFAMASEEARGEDQGTDAGRLPHGQHAGQNIGLSVVRAGRELELDPAWAINYDPRERWWGAEIHFEPGLDELFGVSNNKQSARNFAEAALLDTAALARAHNGSISAAKRAMEDDEDPLAPLVEIAHRIRTTIVEMRNLIKIQTQGRRRERHDRESPEKRATDVVRRRQDEGYTGASDEDETKPKEEREAALAQHFRDQGQEEGTARELAAKTLDSGLKYRMSEMTLEGGAFFSVQSRGGVLIVTLNDDHPAHSLIAGAQNPEDMPEEPATLKERLRAAQEGLEMLLFAWARYEDEQTPERRKAAQQIRFDWGRMAESFLETKTVE